MATDGQPLDCIGKLLHVAVGPLDLSVKTVLRDAIERVVAALRYCLFCLLDLFRKVLSMQVYTQSSH